MSFSSLQDKISENTLKAIDNMGFNSMEKIQEHCIFSILKGENLVGTMKTKTKSNLTFLISAVELIHKISTKSKKGNFKSNNTSQNVKKIKFKFKIMF